MHHSDFIKIMAKFYVPERCFKRGKSCDSYNTFVQKDDVTYLELGIRKGTTFNRVAPLFNQAIAVDSDPNAKKYIKVDNSTFFNMTTDEFFEKKMDLKVDFAFIDADHEYTQLIKDFQSTFKITHEGGLILLHDTHPADYFKLRQEQCNTAFIAASYIRDNFVD